MEMSSLIVGDAQIGKDFFDLMDRHFDPPVPSSTGRLYLRGFGDGLEDMPDLLREDTAPLQAVGMVQEPVQEWPGQPTDDAAVPSFLAFSPPSEAHPGQTAPSPLSQLPRSWHNFLAGSWAEQTERPSDAPQSVHVQPASYPAPAAIDKSSSSAETAAPVPVSKQEARQQRIREKNRRAMQNYRSRQKERYEQAEARAQDLAKQVEQLQLQVELLQGERPRTSDVHLPAQNGALGKVTGRQKNTGTDTAMQDSMRDGQGLALDEWEPRYGWQDFDPQATMVLTALRQTGEPPLRVSAQDLRLMQKSDMTEIYRGFVAKAAPLIVVADDDLNSEAGLELQAMKYELHALASNVSLQNPAIKYSGVMLDPHADSDPDIARKAMERLLKALKLSTGQQIQLCKVHLLVKADLQHLKVQRTEVLAKLMGSHQREERSVQAVDFVGMMEALRKLMHMVQQIHRCHASFGAACWGSTLDHIQVAKAVVLTFPRTVNMWHLTDHLLDTQGPDLLGDSRLLRKVEFRYHKVWRVENKDPSNDGDEESAGASHAGTVQGFNGELHLQLPANVPANGFAPELLL